MLFCKEIALLILEKDSIVYLGPDSYFYLIEMEMFNYRGLVFASVHYMKFSLFLLQFGEWVFTVTGKGTLPQPQEPVSLSAPAGANTTVIIPFRNPLDCAVSVDVRLTGRYSVFCLHYNADNKRRIETQLLCALRLSIKIIVIS